MSDVLEYLRGLSDALGDKPPTKEQWAAIRRRLAEADVTIVKVVPASPFTTPYIPLVPDPTPGLPMYPDPYRPWWGQQTIGGVTYATGYNPSTCCAGAPGGVWNYIDTTVARPTS